MQRTLADTGPLVALFNRRDQHHAWAVERFKELRPPLFSCEAALAEAHYLLAGVDGGREKLLELLHRKVLQLDFTLQDEIAGVRALLARYRDVPMDLADACLVRSTELNPQSRVWTVDTDFGIYRRNGRQTVPVLASWRP